MSTSRWTFSPDVDRVPDLAAMRRLLLQRGTEGVRLSAPAGRWARPRHLTSHRSPTS
ncbi:hypothetical protein G7043_29770 [Lentzea sp. NEAU-D13]|uniref:Uncharacterized protein n=1 Tax=Lentzea alba TaxID=2714351 RepID=A0A7C9VV57_9PSEU|nr:hypothetical protein [Lentzea alba]NGY63115.1 hypothetical protein [Lentzea alba]